MLVLAVLLCCGLIGRSTSINLTYILRKENDKLHPSCIAEDNERYRALGWVFPIPGNENDLPRIRTKYIPNVQSTYNCDFSEHDSCNLLWQIKDWNIDFTSQKTFHFIGDNRWEEFPLTYTSGTTDEFRIEIQKDFQLAFSLRSGHEVNIHICDGWNLRNYPCYNIKINPETISLFKTVPLLKNGTSKALDQYQAFQKIISDDEWRNFVLSFHHGAIKLIDANLNRTTIEYKDNEPLTPEYFIVTSENPALWKVHQNSFLFTTKPSTYRFGPSFFLPSKDLCISFYAWTCKDCEMTFFTLSDNNEKKILKHVPSTGEERWAFVKVKEGRVFADRKVIFVETKLTSGENTTEGFWAVDNVRLCNENEVKVSYLKLNESQANDLSSNISCQIVEAPNWRPRNLIYDKIKEFSEVQVTSNTTSITLDWIEEDPEHKINYFIFYQAKDICDGEPHNKKRVKSNGFLMTKYNKIVIDDLVPFTQYNISLSTVLHENDKQIITNTLQTESPTLEELPNKLQVQTKQREVYLTWQKVDCLSIYGDLVHSLEITGLTGNFSKKLTDLTENSLEIDGLEPFTPYTLKIVTARNKEDLNNYQNVHQTTMNFTTSPGVASPVKNLEIYAIGKNSASLRYDLPKSSKGVPSGIKVDKCNALSAKKCKPSFLPILNCTLWKNKHCVYLTNLMENQKYIFKVSLKNYNTPDYGEETVLEDKTVDKKPGMPTNITYQVVDCMDSCNLNISWMHPYDQNGVITAFHLKLNSTKQSKEADEVKTIHEVLRIMNEKYQPTYNYQVKYIPYSTSYDLYIQAVNLFHKSNAAKTTIITDHLGNHIDQSPELIDADAYSFKFKLPTLDRRLDSCTITIAVQDFNKDMKLNGRLLGEKVADNLCHGYGDAWVSKIVNVTSNETKTVTIGKPVEEKNVVVVKDQILRSNTKYCLTFIVTNQYKQTEHDVVYYETVETLSGPRKEASSSSAYNHLYVLLLLLMLVPIGFFGYRYMKKRRSRPNASKDTQDNIYESLPFEECEDKNSVNNYTYDKLLHK